MFVSVEGVSTEIESTSLFRPAAPVPATGCGALFGADGDRAAGIWCALARVRLMSDRILRETGLSGRIVVCNYLYDFLAALRWQDPDFACRIAEVAFEDIIAPDLIIVVEREEVDADRVLAVLGRVFPWADVCFCSEEEVPVVLAELIGEMPDVRPKLLASCG